MRYNIEIFPLVDCGTPDQPGMKSTIDAPGDVAWRWMAVVKWRTPEHPAWSHGFVCRRAMDPVKLARWAYAVLRREAVSA
jgi:hypothetical protein